MIENILSGAEVFFAAGPLFWLVFGVVAGFTVGALPGFSGSNAAALVLPFSITLSTASALILMGGIYAGASFAGSIPAILVNAPGTAGAAATALDGYPMTQAGRPDRAIGIARMASVTGGVIGSLIVLTIIGPMSSIALRFGAVELFIVALFGIVIIASVIGNDVRKGLISAVLGLLIAAMSASPLTAQPRFTFGFIQFYEEVPFVPAIIGLFALTQMFVLATQDRLIEDDPGEQTAGEGGAEALGGLRASIGEIWEGVRTTLRYPFDLLRSSVLGTFIGVVPGVGTAVANFISYGIARQRSRTPENFGKGAPEGIIASEACDNAVTSGTLVPTLTLGIPGSATSAIMLAALYLHGVQPGPRVMSANVGEAYAVLLAMLFASLLIFPLGIILAAPLAQITRVKPAFLVTAVVLLCVVGAFAVRNSLFDAGLALVFGVLGFAMRQFGYPVVPLVIGLVLGPIAEENLMRALTLGNYQIGYFFQSPISIVLWTMLFAMIVFNIIRSFMKRRES